MKLVVREIKDLQLLMVLRVLKVLKEEQVETDRKVLSEHLSKVHRVFRVTHHKVHKDL